MTAEAAAKALRNGYFTYISRWQAHFEGFDLKDPPFSTQKFRKFSSVNIPENALYALNGKLIVGKTEVYASPANQDFDRSRLEALLAVTFSRQLRSTQLRHAVDALQVSRFGDQAHANLYLALANLPRVFAERDLAARISMANMLLASGMTAEDLVQALGLDSACAKYDPDQARVPSGYGRQSGRWTKDGGTNVTSASVDATTANAATLAVALRASSVLATDLGATAMAALSTLVTGIGFGVAAGLLVVPSPNSVSTRGLLPGDTGHTYDFDRDTGVLRVIDAAGEPLAVGPRDKAGVFFDAATGVPFAREVGGSLVFDGAAMAAVKQSDDAEDMPAVIPRAQTDEDKPKLCPDPGADQPGSESAKQRARDYQEQISRMINPQRPLKYGLAMNLTNPLTGNTVHFDECDERTGTMIETKGPGFDGVLSFPQGAESLNEDWLDQSYRQIQAAGNRQIVWYFAEQYAAGYAARLFEREGEGREKIVVRVHPADKP